MATLSKKCVAYRYQATVLGLILPIVSATTMLIRTNPNPLKSSCSVEVWDHLCLHISPILYYIYTLANMTSTYQCMPPVCRTLCIKFHLILTWLTNAWTLEYISNILRLASISFMIESWQNTEFVDYFSVLWTLSVQSSISPSVFQLSSRNCSEFDHNLYSFCVLVTWNCADSIYHRLVCGVKPKTSPKHILYPKYTPSLL